MIASQGLSVYHMVYPQIHHVFLVLFDLLYHKMHGLRIKMQKLKRYSKSNNPTAEVFLSIPVVLGSSNLKDLMPKERIVLPRKGMLPQNWKRGSSLDSLCPCKIRQQNGFSILELVLTDIAKQRVIISFCTTSIQLCTRGFLEPQGSSGHLHILSCLGVEDYSKNISKVSPRGIPHSQIKAERVSSLGKGPTPSSFKEALFLLFFKHSIIMTKDVIKCTHGHMIACRNDIIDPHLCSLQYTGVSTYSSFPFFFLPPLTSTKPNGLFLQKPGSWNIKID